MYDLKMNELNLVSGGNSENPPLGIFVDSQLWKDMLENARQLAQSISSASITVIGNCANGAAVGGLGGAAAGSLAPVFGTTAGAIAGATVGCIATVGIGIVQVITAPAPTGSTTTGSTPTAP